MKVAVLKGQHGILSNRVQSRGLRGLLQNGLRRMHPAHSCAAFFDVLSGGDVTISGMMTIGEAQAVQAVREVMAGGTIPPGNSGGGGSSRVSGRDPAALKKTS
jgi:hypothetical protein